MSKVVAPVLKPCILNSWEGMVETTRDTHPPHSHKFIQHHPHHFEWQSGPCITGIPHPFRKLPPQTSCYHQSLRWCETNFDTLWKKRRHQGENPKPTRAPQEIFIKSLSAFITIVQGSVSSNAHQQHTGIFYKTVPESSHRKRKRYTVCDDSHTILLSG